MDKRDKGSVWNRWQNNFSCAEGLSSIEIYARYAPQLQQGQAEDNQLDYFSGQLGEILCSQIVRQLGNQSDISLSHDELDQSLSSSNPFLSNKCVTTAQPYSSVLRLGIQMVDDTSSKSSLRDGQITSIILPLEESLLLKQEVAKVLISKSRENSPDSPSKASKIKKRRKSKRKNPSEEQQVAKRMRILERNRVAADKCRQKKREAVDNLQTKAQILHADYIAKKAELEKVEQGIVELKLKLSIHSKLCNGSDIMTWIEQESSRILHISRGHSERLGDAIVL